MDEYLFNLLINGIFSSNSYAFAANINAVAAYKKINFSFTLTY